MVEAIKDRVGQPVSMVDLFSIVSLNTISRMSMSTTAGSSYHGQNPYSEAAAGSDNTELPALLLLQSDLIGLQGVGDAIPWLSFLDSWFILRVPIAKYKQVKRQLDDFYLRVIQEHRLSRDSSKSHDKPRDFVDEMVDISDSGSEVVGHPVTDDVIGTQINDLIAAGTTTTSLSLEWAMAELLRQPAVLERATQEVEQVVGRGGTVSESDIRNLPYLQAVVKETLRLHPPAPFLLPHYSSQATALGGYHIPAGTPLLVNVWALAKTLIFGRILTSSNPSGSSSPTAPPGRTWTCADTTSSCCPSEPARAFV